MGLVSTAYIARLFPKTAPETRYEKLQVPRFSESLWGDDVLEETADSYRFDGLSAYACSKASRGENFDFFEVKEVKDGLVSFYLGDVSGKGIAASLCQAVCTSVLKLASTITTDPVSIVSEVNDSLSRRGIEGRFVTLLYGTLDITSGKLRLLSAGHPDPILISENDETRLLPCKPCLPVGILAEHKYVVTEYWLKPGDTLLLYSDGITEARDVRREFFGEDRLQEIAQCYNSTLPRVLIDRIFEKLETFTSSRKDDQTALALHFSGLHSEFTTKVLQRAC